MVVPTQQLINNHLLRSLSPYAFDSLKHHIVAVDLPFGTVLAESGEPIGVHFFLAAGLASTLARSGDGRVIEAGLLGTEAMTGHEVALTVDRHPNKVTMQIAGSGWQISSHILRDLVEKDRDTRALLLRYVHTFQLQVTHSGLANARYTVHQRLARWLLMTHDRVKQDELFLTHELLSMMLGVRRAGVTDALHIIEATGAVQASRGRIRVLLRDQLEELAGGSYGIPEDAYRQLLGEQVDCQAASSGR